MFGVFLNANCEVYPDGINQKCEKGWNLNGFYGEVSAEDYLSKNKGIIYLYKDNHFVAFSNVKSISGSISHLMSGDTSIKPGMGFWVYGFDNGFYPVRSFDSNVSLPDTAPPLIPSLKSQGAPIEVNAVIDKSNVVKSLIGDEGVVLKLSHSGENSLIIESLKFPVIPVNFRQINIEFFDSNYNEIETDKLSYDEINIQENNEIILNKTIYDREIYLKINIKPKIVKINYEGGKYLTEVKE